MTERQSARMSKVNNGGLDQYGAGPFEQQQFGTVGVEMVKSLLSRSEMQLGGLAMSLLLITDQ